MRVSVWDRTRAGARLGPARHAASADGRAHFEYAQREPVAGVELLRDVSFRAAGEHLAIDLPGATALFTTRRGGVSDGPVRVAEPRALDRRRPERVAREPRARARAAGAARLAQGRQVHGDARRRRRGTGGEEADGQVTTRRRRRARSCSSPTACRSRSAGPSGVGDAPRAAGAGWPAAWSRRASRRARRRGPVARRRSGPARAVLLRGRRGGPRGVRAPSGAHARPQGGRPRAARGRRRRARSTTAACARSCDERFFSHRRDGGVTGRQAGVAWRS